MTASNPGYELQHLADGHTQMSTAKGAAALNAGQTATLLNIPPGNAQAGQAVAGVVDKIRFISSGNICIDGWLQISYDGGATFPFVAELGTLFLSRPGNSANAGQHTPPIMESCAHLGTQQQYSDFYNDFFFEGDFTYPIPYTNGILIQVTNPSPYNYSAASMYWEVTYAPYTTYAVPNYQLRCTGSGMPFANVETNNFTFASGGFTIPKPNVSMNGSNGGFAINLTQSQQGQLANITGRGWAAGLAYVSQGQNPGDLSWLERGFGWYIDGATQPVLGVSSPGSPTFQTTGTEDTFDSAWYTYALTTTQGSTAVGGSPAIAATNVSVTNPFINAADVYIVAPALVSAVTINGTATGLSIAAGDSKMVRVPPQGTIALTYASTAPTWKWFVSDIAPGGNKQSFSKPTSMVLCNGSSARGSYYNGFLDILQGSGGYRFGSSLSLWLLNNAAQDSSSHNLSWCLLYYQDLT